MGSLAELREAEMRGAFEAHTDMRLAAERADAALVDRERVSPDGWQVHSSLQSTI